MYVTLDYDWHIGALQLAVVSNVTNPTTCGWPSTWFWHILLAHHDYFNIFKLLSPDKTAAHTYTENIFTTSTSKQQYLECTSQFVWCVMKEKSWHRFSHLASSSILHTAPIFSCTKSQDEAMAQQAGNSKIEWNLHSLQIWHMLCMSQVDGQANQGTFEVIAVKTNTIIWNTNANYEI